ncbi:MAG TPA: hypothetical protein VGM92_12895, partial [Candidatus Kapabacteria bacterium]
DMEIEEYMTAFHSWLFDSRDQLADFSKIHGGRNAFHCLHSECLPSQCTHRLSLQYAETFETSEAMDHLLASLRTKIENHDYVVRIGLN